MPKPLTAADMGRKGGQSRSPRKLAAIRKNLEKANKTLRKLRRLTAAKRLG